MVFLTEPYLFIDLQFDVLQDPFLTLILNLLDSIIIQNHIEFSSSLWIPSGVWRSYYGYKSTINFLFLESYVADRIIGFCFGSKPYQETKYLHTCIDTTS